VESILPDPDLREFVQKFAGYSCTGSTKEEKFIFAFGDGGRGKGTLLESLGSALGDYSTTLAVEVLMLSKTTGSGNEPSPELAKLPGIRLLLASETNQGSTLDEARVKSMTGGDMQTARRLRCNPFDFLPNFKLWFSSNFRPNIRDNSEGIWRRLRLVPFEQDFTGAQRDIELKPLLREQGLIAEIISWMVDGCLKWQSEGLKEPAKIIEATAAYREETDLIGRFIGECCLVERGKNTGSKVLYRVFKMWCLDNGHTPHNQPNFVKLMEQKKYRKQKLIKGIFWLNLVLVNPFDL
jgi:putative DNA primase/helicase